MNPTFNTTSTRVSPHMARLWQMLNILFTIRSFEMKVAANEEKIRKILEDGAFKLLPTYTKTLRTEYQGAIDSWKIRIREEEGNYNVLLNQIVAHSLTYTDIQPVASDLPEHRIIDHDDDIESMYHQRKCGGIK